MMAASMMAQGRQRSPAPFLEDDDKGNENLNRSAQRRPDHAPAGSEQRHDEVPSPSGINGRAHRKSVELPQDLLLRHGIVVTSHPLAASCRAIGRSIASLSSIGPPNRENAPARGLD